jgi:hypothetical protein
MVHGQTRIDFFDADGSESGKMIRIQIRNNVTVTISLVKWLYIYSNFNDTKIPSEL